MRRRLRSGEAFFDVEVRREGGALLAELGGVSCSFEILAEGPDHLVLRVEGRVERFEFAREEGRVWLSGRGPVWRLEAAEPARSRAPRGQGGGQGGQEGVLRSPMPALVTSVEVGEGEEVEGGAALLSLEAMKMETRIAAPPGAWKVFRLPVAPGERVARDQVLVELAPRGGEGSEDAG